MVGPFKIVSANGLNLQLSWEDSFVEGQVTFKGLAANALSLMVVLFFRRWWERRLKYLSI
jgi:hypothetical protein